MPSPNEAEGLLLNGAMYPRRLGLRAVDGSLDLLGVKHAGFALYHEDGPFFHFDFDGRWQRMVVGSTHFLKNLDNSVEAIDRTRDAGEMILERRSCNFAEVADLDQLARQSAIDLLRGLAARQFDTVAPPQPGRALDLEEVRALLERASSWDAAAWFRHRELYVATYGPLGLIPPDARQSLVLQATDDQGNYRSSDQFRQHARDVRRLLGSRLAQSRSVYLAGAHAFHAPAVQIEDWLQAATEVLGVTDATGPPRPGWLRESEPRIDSIQGLIHDTSINLPSVDSWRRFSAMHLGRITIAPPHDTDLFQLLQVVADLKHSSLTVSILLEMAEVPEAFLGCMLGRGDKIFLTGDRRSSRSTALDEWRLAHGVKILSYSMHKQG